MDPRMQRLFEAFQHSLRLASDEKILGVLKSPQPPFFTQGDVAMIAASIGRGGLVLRALERGVLSPDTRCHTGTLVHIAAAFGPLELLKALILERGVDPNEEATDGSRPLHLAIDAGREEAALLPINEAPGVDIDAPTPSGLTPLILAGGFGRMEVLRALVAKGADVNAKSEEGLSALQVAIDQGKEEAALYLVEAAAAAVYDPDAPKSALGCAAAYSLCRAMRAIVRRMRADGMDNATVAAEMGAAVQYAVEQGVESLKVLMEEGLDVGQAPVIIRDEDGNGHPLFHHDCMYGNREAAALLVERGCDPLSRNDDGGRAHHVLAARPDGLPMLKWLMASFPIPVDEPTTPPYGVSGLTMLHYAAAGGRLETAQWLVEASGADVLKTAQGFAEGPLRPSQIAEAGGHAAVAAYLREKEAEAEAALEAAARRARNEKRRQKQKKAKARRRAAAEGQEEGGAGADGSGDEEGETGDGAATSVGAAAGGASGGGGGGGGSLDGEQEAAAGEQQQEKQEEDQDVDPELLAAAIAMSLAPPEEEEQPPQPPPSLEEFLEARAPESMLCPITLHLLDDPVLLVGDGCTYSRAAIEAHMAFCRQKGKPLTSPSTNVEISAELAILAPNVYARGQVLEFKAATTREWEALQREWEEATGAGGKG